MNTNNEILKNYMGCKAYENVMSTKLLKNINKSEKERFLIYNINNFLVAFRETLSEGERIDLMTKLDYFPQYSVEDYSEYFKTSEFLVLKENGHIFVSLPKKTSGFSFVKKI